MEELLKTLVSLLENGETDNVNVKIEEDKDGNITLKYNAPKKSKLVTKIQTEFDEMDDDIFQEAAEKFKALDFESFKVLAAFEDKNIDEKKLSTAFKGFKHCVKEIVEGRIKILSDETNRLFTKYLDKK